MYRYSQGNIYDASDYRYQVPYGSSNVVPGTRYLVSLLHAGIYGYQYQVLMPVDTGIPWTESQVKYLTRSSSIC